MTSQLSRPTLRIEYVEGSGSLDELLVEHIESLRAISPNRQQEWMRNALRNAYVMQRLMVLSPSPESADKSVLDDILQQLTLSNKLAGQLAGVQHIEV